MRIRAAGLQLLAPALLSLSNNVGQPSRFLFEIGRLVVLSNCSPEPVVHVYRALACATLLNAMVRDVMLQAHGQRFLPSGFDHDHSSPFVFTNAVKLTVQSLHAPVLCGRVQTDAIRDPSHQFPPP